MASGLCSYLDLRDNLTLDEAVTLLEVLMVRSENERRAHEVAVAKARRST